MIKVFFGQELPPGNYPLSAYKKAIIKRTTNEKRRYELIFGEYFLINSLKTLYHNLSLPLQIAVTTTNKPFLVNYDIHFNLSHSNNCFLLALAKQEVGVDIEKIDQKHLIIAGRILSKMEKKDYDTHQAKEEYITKIWTIKESYLKLLGLGLTLNLSAINTNYLKTVDFIEYYEIDEAIISCKKINDYYISIAYKDKNDQVELMF